MLELQLTLIEDELDHHTGNQGQGDRSHEDEVIGACRLFNVNEFLIYWEWLIDHIECKLWITGCHSEDRLIHELGKHSCGVWRSSVDVANDCVVLSLPIGFVELVRAV